MVVFAFATATLILVIVNFSLFSHKIHVANETIKSKSSINKLILMFPKPLLHFYV